ncbi:hypothetical protein DFP72DRAFT_1163501 [Ephemerocybe angulata]|uniref:Uncharacterized protein n=1 Tax=Ephemerocybe angulata TaxID=980116 RepID=A0A8H6MGD5_9AGAR|nr:hypothetical protein DFP72DRAFT_1163501 [Tulosesus angulatus]
MRFATTLTLLSALIFSGSSVLAVPVPGTDTISNDLTSLGARELSYESTVDARAFGFDAPILEERGIWRKLKNKFTGGSSTELEGRELEDELLERTWGTSSTPPVKGGGVSSRYRRSLSAADLRRRREELEPQRDIRMALRNLGLRRRELEREIVERSGHGRW